MMPYKIKKIEEFLEEVEKDSLEGRTFSLQIMMKWQKKIQFIFSIAADQKYYHGLMKCVVKYIELIVFNLHETSNKRQLTYSKNFFSKIEALIGEDKKDAFLCDVTEKVLEIVTDATAYHWGVIKELLKVYCRIIKGTTAELRSYTMQQLSDMWLYKLTDSISTFRDYDLQLLIIEVIMVLYGKTHLNSKITELIPESQELSEQFVGIDSNHFHRDVRRFLNMLNQNSGNVFSIICDNIKLGEYICITHVEDMEGLWVDFNMTNYVVSWYCSIGTFDIGDDKSKAFELITILAEDISSYEYSSSPSGDNVIVKLTLRSQPLNLHDEYKLIMGNITQCLFMLKNSDAAKKLIRHVLPAMLRSKVISEEVSASGVDFDLRSPRRSENLEKSIYGADTSVKTRDFWDLSKSMNPSSDSFEAISESSVSQHSERSGLGSGDQDFAQHQAPPVTGKKRLVSSNSAFRKSNQPQPLPVIIEESVAHNQMVADSQDKTAALQAGSEGFYTAKDQMSLDLDSMDVNVCEDVALQSQLAAFKVHEKENQKGMQAPKPRVAVPSKNHESCITVSDTAEFGADIRIAENEKEKSRRKMPLQERNAQASVKDIAAPTIGSPTLCEVAVKRVKLSTPTILDAVLADSQTFKVSQTIEECIVEEHHDDDGVDLVINLVSSDTDATLVPTKKKKVVRKLDSSPSEEIQSTGRSAKDSRTQSVLSSGDENFVTQCGKEPKRLLGKVRSRRAIRKAQDKIQSITERSREITRLNSSASAEIMEQESRMVRKIVKDISADKEQHKIRKVLSLDKNDNEPDAFVDLQKMNSNSDESVFAATYNSPPDKSSSPAQANKKAFVSGESGIEKELAISKKGNVTKTLETDVKPTAPQSLRKAPQRINSDHESIFGASGAPSEKIDGKSRSLRLSGKSMDRTTQALIAKENSKRPDPFLSDEIAVQLKRMHSPEDGAENLISSSFRLEKEDEKARSKQQVKDNSEAKKGSVKKEFALPEKENTIHSSNDEHIGRKSRATQQAANKKVEVSRNNSTEIEENTRIGEDDINSQKNKIQAESRITRQSKTKNMSAARSGFNQKNKVAKKGKTTKILKTEESHALSEDDIGSSSEQRFTVTKSNASLKKVTKPKMKNIGVVKSKFEDREVAVPKEHKTTKTLTIDKAQRELESLEYDSNSSSEEGITAAKSSVSPRKTKAKTTITRQTKTKNINVVKTNSKSKKTATPKKSMATKIVNTNEQATENDISSFTIIAGNSRLPPGKKQITSRVNPPAKTKDLVKSSIDKNVSRKDKSIKSLAAGENSKKPNEYLDDEINSWSGDTSSDFGAPGKKKRKSKKTRPSTKRTVESKINDSSDESLLFFRKQKKLRKLDSSLTDDGKISETPEEVAHEKYLPRGVIIEGNTSESVKAKISKIEESTDQKFTRKTYVDDWLEEIEAADWVRMPSSPNDGKISKTPAKVAHQKSRQMDVIIEGNTSESITAKSSKTEDSTDQKFTRKAYVDDWLEKIEAADWERMPSSPNDGKISKTPAKVAHGKSLQMDVIIEGNTSESIKAKSSQIEDSADQKSTRKAYVDDLLEEIEAANWVRMPSCPNVGKISKTPAKVSHEKSLQMDVIIDGDTSKSMKAKSSQIEDSADQKSTRKAYVDDLLKEVEAADWVRKLSGPNDGKISKTPAKVAHEKSLQMDVIIEGNTSESIKAKSSQIEDSTDQKSTRKAYVDDLLKEIEAADWVRMPSSPANKSKCEDEFDKLKNGATEKTYLKSAELPEASENNLHAETELGREQIASVAESHASKIVIISDVVVKARDGHRQEDGGADEDIILGTPLENPSNRMNTARNSKPMTTDKSVDTQKGQDVDGDAASGTAEPMHATELEQGITVQNYRKRKRKLFDETVPWHDVPVPNLDDKSNDTHVTRTEERVRHRNWRGLTLLIKQPEETSHLNISPVANMELKNNGSQVRPSKKVTFGSNKNRDGALSVLEKYEEQAKKRYQHDTWSHPRLGPSKGTRTRGLGAFDDFMESLLNGSKQKSKTNKTWSYPKRERASRKSTSHRLSRKKPFDTVMREEKEDMSPVAATKRLKRAVDGNVTPEFEEDPVKIPPIRSMPEGENDVLVNDLRKEHGEYVFELIEAPEWDGSAVVKGSKRSELRSSDFQGKYLLMFFYPSDFGYIVAAPKELEEFSAAIDTLKSLNVEVVGCCTNDINVHMELLAQKPNILIPLVADSTLEISMAFGVYVPKWGHNLRAAIFIDPKGTILWRFLLHDATRCLPVNELVSFVKCQVS